MFAKLSFFSPFLTILRRIMLYICAIAGVGA